MSDDTIEPGFAVLNFGAAPMLVQLADYRNHKATGIAPKWLYEAVRLSLCSIRDEGPKRESHGVCYNIELYFDEWAKTREDLWGYSEDEGTFVMPWYKINERAVYEKWTQHCEENGLTYTDGRSYASDCMYYPIACPPDKLEEYEESGSYYDTAAEFAFDSTTNLWEDDEYGDARLQYLDFLIELFTV